MFLVRGHMYHEAVWTQWLEDVAGIVPSSVACDEELSKCYKGMQERNSPPRSPYDEQSFYSIVIHTKPDFPGYSEGSIFNGRIVEERIQVVHNALLPNILPYRLFGHKLAHFIAISNTSCARHHIM